VDVQADVMDDADVTLEPASEADLDSVEDLLSRCELPTADVREQAECFYLGTRGDRVVGVGGLEPYGSDGLLRSVAVEPSVRGQGVDSAIAEALEAEARESGIETLYLLTTTAADFFGSRGYERIEREAAPDAIAATSQFADLCPESATCMRRAL
jgi:amino-acid N-acetyltransferase